MLWPGAVLAFVFIFASTQITEITSEDGYIGCLFSKTLCEDDEWCYDDFVFGRCLPSTSADVDDLYRYDLDKDTIRQFSRELERLFYLGYRWSHDYTQCRLQTMLHSIRNDLTFENNACSYLVDQDLAGALKALEVENLPEPQEMAIVKYTPSADNPHADFADEVYFPPSDGGGFQNRIVAPNDRDVYELEAPFSESEIKKHKRGFGSRGSLNVADYDSTGNVPLETELSRYFAEKNNDLFFKNYIFPQKGLNGMEKISSALKENFYPENGNFDAYNEIPMVFSMSYNTPDNFRAGWESKDLNQALMNEFPESRVYFDDNEQEVQQPVEYGSGIETPGDANFDHYGYDTPDNGKLLKAYETLLRDAASQKPILDDVKSRLFTEGGVIYPNRHYESVAGNEAPGMLDLLKGFNVGFQRPERLDVKKPGPTYDKKAIEEEDKQIKSFNENEILPKIMKKEPRGAHPNPFYHDIYDIETDFVYVVFENRIHTWNEGIFLIRNITAMIKLPRGVVSHERVGHNEVTFKIGPNSGMNATEVVEKIDKLQNAINRETGFRIIAAGVGDTIKRQSVIKAPLLLSSTMLSDDAWFVGIIACGLLASSVIAIGTLVIIKKCINSRDKLSGLPHRDNEASKDYQDLCRARMATKCQISNETVHGRIASLSKESEQSPPSRSSTSSWSEEPALHNMDISTGHMVLSYMEDHLRNKDRLDQEWIALCAYVAEPSETKAAKKKENVDKNRYADIVPYDHSRVVLNELSNANGSDYINASSITDHDPRNPTYIATQGPLPHTASDFWQLIWEQGAVVIVMLTRLTEGGSAMCHRYWPEEGSDLYHIYEIHLVSEHIWCDDYLVRSFYLKNTRTGETRTVTQFHFLSWPEGSIPGSTKTLLEFRRKVNKSYRGRSCPIVVHCSDGAGRTGTYCLIDMVLSRMAKGAKEIDIAATLEHLRDQRPKMVATKQQFEFVLTAVAEEVHAILKALPPQPSTGLNQEKEK